MGDRGIEAKGMWLTSLLTKEALVMDVCRLTSALFNEAQEKFKTLLLNHYHPDHTRGLITLGANVPS
jgi:ribonuclease BN (tRNA processing enzyme)